MNIRLALPLKLGAYHQDGHLSPFEDFMGGESLELAWTQLRISQTEYLLHTKSCCFARLIFHPAQSPYAFAELDDERIYLKYTKYPLPKVILSKNRNIGTKATFEPDLNWCGELVFDSGRRFIWQQDNLKKGKTGFLNLYQVPILDFQARHGFLKSGSNVQIHTAGKDNPHLPYLVLMGWFLNLIR